MKTRRFLSRMTSLLAIICMVSLAGCGGMTSPSLGGGTVQQATDGGAVQKKAVQINKCPRPIGAVALNMGEGMSSYLTHWKLGSPIPASMRIMKQSGCYTKILSRGAGLGMAERERQLAAGSGLQSERNVGKGQYIAADYGLTIYPGNVSTTGGVGGGAVLGSLVPGLWGSAAAVIGGALEKKEADVTIELVSIKTSELWSEVGHSEKRDWKMGGGAGSLFRGAVALGGYERTPGGQLLVMAIIDAHNRLIQQMQDLR